MPLPVEGVGEDLEGGFVLLCVGSASTQGAAADSLESADKRFDMPAQAVALFLEAPRGHLRAIHSAQCAISTLARGLDPALHAPHFAAHSMQPVRIISGIGIQ